MWEIAYVAVGFCSLDLLERCSVFYLILFVFVSCLYAFLLVLFFFLCSVEAGMEKNRERVWGKREK